MNGITVRRLSCWVCEWIQGVKASSPKGSDLAYRTILESVKNEEKKGIVFLELLMYFTSGSTAVVKALRIDLSIAPSIC